MQTLVNLAIKSDILQNWFNDDYEKLLSFLKAHKIDGIEAILYEPGNLDLVPVGLAKGLHLIYWPMWLDLWLDNKTNLLKEFITAQNIDYYYGFNHKDALINKYSEEFQAAKILNVDYMVFHVSQISIEETYTREFNYSSQIILDETIKLVNRVFTGSGPLLLFENLWSNGLNFLDYDMTKYFIENIQYENKGFMLDISHLLITNPSISSYEEAADYLSTTLSHLKELRKYIKGIHLNKPSFSDYIRENHQKRKEASCQKTDFVEKLIDVYHHISKIDTHLPYEDANIMTIIDDLSPSYLVYELMPSDLEDWSSKIITQQRYLTR